jgi:hypothetical protein
LQPRSQSGVSFCVHGYPGRNVKAVPPGTAETRLERPGASYFGLSKNRFAALDGRPSDYLIEIEAPGTRCRSSGGAVCSRPMLADSLFGVGLWRANLTDMLRNSCCSVTVRRPSGSHYCETKVAFRPNPVEQRGGSHRVRQGAGNSFHDVCVWVQAKQSCPEWRRHCILRTGAVSVIRVIISACQAQEPVMLMNLPLNLLLITVIGIIPLTACKTWYKAGAVEEDLSADQRRCVDEAESSTGKVFVECMERAGWWHTDMSATATDSEIPDPSVVELEATPTTVQRHRASSNKTTETQARSPDNIHTTGAPNAARTAAEPQQPRGWIQFGADTQQLEHAKAECGRAGVASKAFSQCMKGKGWHRVRLTVEEPGDLD